MGSIPALFVLACAATTQTSDAPPQAARSYDAVMQAQYAAHGTPAAQRADEAKRIYENYLNSIGQKTKSNSDNSPGNAGDPSR